MDTDSDSDVEVVPAKRPLTTRRKLVPLKNVGESEPSQSIYMSKVDLSMKAIQSGVNPKVAADTSDVEGDAEEVFSKGTKKLRGRKILKPTKELHTESQKDDVIDLGESDDENIPEVCHVSTDDHNDSLRERERSPTPPPEVSSILPKKRAPRRTKALKNAVSALEDLNFRQKLRAAVDKVHSDVVIVDETIASPSPVKAAAVKVRSLSGLHRFSMNKTDSFTAILNKVAEAESVSVDRCILYKEDKKIEPYDTPDSINLHIADILDLHIRKHNEAIDDALDLDDPDVIELQVQTNDPRSKLVLPVHQNTRLEKVMREYAKQRNLDYDKLTFYFDGEIIEESQTPAMLEMESDDCIDVVGASSNSDDASCPKTQVANNKGSEDASLAGNPSIGPTRWKPMDPNPKAGYILVPLEADCEEYLNLTVQFHATMLSPRAEIKSVYRVQNPILWQFFSVKKLQMQQQMRQEQNRDYVDERLLFHGTNPDVIDPICKNGFDWRLCGVNGTAYGQGSYFARDALYSHRYTGQRNGPVASYGSKPANSRKRKRSHKGKNNQTVPSIPAYLSAVTPSIQPRNLFQRLGVLLSALAGPHPTGSTSSYGLPAGLPATSHHPSTGHAPSDPNDPVMDLNVMFVARVLVGQYAQGTTHYRKPPPLSQQQPYGRCFDSCVDNPTDPAIFVIFESSQCYPDYIIEYVNRPGMY